jgi:aspartate-semialdehyde dehydrogenase
MNVGVIGATGLVGQEMLRVLDERSFPVAELRVYASPRLRVPPLGGSAARVRRSRGHL